MGTPFASPEAAVGWLGAVFSDVVTIDRRMVGAWRRLVEKGTTEIGARLRRPLDTRAATAAGTAARRCERFIALRAR